MPRSPMRRPHSLASATQSAMVTPATGTKGQTSIAPMRAWLP